jgi:thiol-disulfide isomerase/thioredoxin
MIDFQKKWESALGYDDYLAAHGSESDRQRWKSVYDAVQLTDAQKDLLSSFVRRMPVLCMSGAWCGDCVEQCPILRRIEEENPLIEVRFIDRDADEELKSQLTICGGARVPQAVFLSEDFTFVARSSDKTLTKFRQLANSAGAACSTGIVSSNDDAFHQSVNEWMELVERCQLTLRLSSRLRQLHGD